MNTVHSHIQYLTAPCKKKQNKTNPHFIKTLDVEFSFTL